MRSLPSAVPAALAGALLLAACGTQQDGPRSNGAAERDAVTTGGRPGTAACGGQSSAAALPGDPAEPEKDGVRVTGMRSGPGACADYEVTNHGRVPVTYTITFTFLSGSGEALASTEQTVPSVGPGRTVRRTVTTSALPADARVRIGEVRSVSAAEAPNGRDACPSSGVRVYADKGDAAMGLRAVSLRLENCGTRTQHLDGYPRLELLDGDHESVKAVRVVRGGSAIATGTGADGPPRPLALKPGERAHAVMVWRNTVEAGAGDPVHAPYARVWAKPGAAPVTVTPEFDLGTTGKLGVGPWKKDETTGPAAGRGTGG
ncbi:DUF4232 domain-containing protein [Streptomyces sp. NPDC018031]|uniref:DUF4232 domain-containing protein n=1 Tax=Streptomyces sp. NPDC018031 TaxID=3365033 RepID=UPI0037ABB5E4